MSGCPPKASGELTQKTGPILWTFIDTIFSRRCVIMRIGLFWIKAIMTNIYGVIASLLRMVAKSINRIKSPANFSLSGSPRRSFFWSGFGPFSGQDLLVRGFCTQSLPPKTVICCWWPETVRFLPSDSLKCENSLVASSVTIETREKLSGKRNCFLKPTYPL